MSRSSLKVLRNFPKYTQSTLEVRRPDFCSAASLHLTNFIFTKFHFID